MQVSRTPSLPAPPRVLLIQHDAAISGPIAQNMEQSGMMVAVAPTVAKGLALRSTFHPDVVLLDLELPDAHRVDIIGWFTERPDCGVIAISRNDAEADRILGLELGADDYLAKPPPMGEMLARIRAVHRRVNRTDPVAGAEGGNIVTIGPISINFALRTVSTADTPRIPLTAAEYALLEALALAGGKPLSRDTLSEIALRRPWQPENRAVDQLVFGLRQKLPRDPNGVPLIHSIRSAGYLLRAPQFDDRAMHRRPEPVAA